jgi:hypothetical protein
VWIRINAACACVIGFASEASAKKTFFESYGEKSAKVVGTAPSDVEVEAKHPSHTRVQHGSGGRFAAAECEVNPCQRVERMDHRERRYEEECRAAALPRRRAPTHPLDGRSRGSQDNADDADAASMGPLGGGETSTSVHTDPLRSGGGGGGGFVDPLGASGGGGSGGGSSGGGSGGVMEFSDPLRALGGGGLASSSSGGQLSRDERASEVMNGTGGGAARAKVGELYKFRIQ